MQAKCYARQKWDTMTACSGILSTTGSHTFKGVIYLSCSSEVFEMLLHRRCVAMPAAEARSEIDLRRGNNYPGGNSARFEADDDSSFKSTAAKIYRQEMYSCWLRWSVDLHVLSVVWMTTYRPIRENEALNGLYL